MKNMLKRFQYWIKNLNLFTDAIDHDDVIRDVEGINNKRKQQLNATRLYIIMFISKTDEVICFRVRLE